MLLFRWFSATSPGLLVYCKGPFNRANSSAINLQVCSPRRTALPGSRLKPSPYQHATADTCCVCHNADTDLG